MAPEMSRLEPWTKKWQKCGLRWIATAATDSEEIFGFLHTMKSFLDQKFQPLGDVDSIGVALSEAGGCEMIKHLTHPQFDKTYKRLKAFSGNIMKDTRWDKYAPEFYSASKAKSDEAAIKLAKVARLKSDFEHARKLADSDIVKRGILSLGEDVTRKPVDTY
jgi:hypothetical protein